MVQMFAWFSADAALASRSKRLSACVFTREFVGKELQCDMATELDVFRFIDDAPSHRRQLCEGCGNGRLSRPRVETE